jgi:hypothetical protein
MQTILLALAAGLLGGITAGGVIGWRLCRPCSARVPCDHVSIDPDIERRINRASMEWATAHHQPSAAPLVADKLRLVYRLNRRRERRRDRRWSR